MNPQVVTAAIILRGTQVLVTRRAPGEKLAGMWEFPGGKIANCETPESCLQREILEELNITGKTGDHLCDSLYEYSSGSILLKAYFFDWQGGDMVLTVHDSCRWIEPEELDLIELAPADVPIAATVKEYLRDLYS